MTLSFEIVQMTSAGRHLQQVQQSEMPAECIKNLSMQHVQQKIGM
ncbi:unnamed protein product [Callosobruchus maculatus]|uniref:Uncharacterized protein n=1 Tax=Callosobruchus maculatus TaxID=64391 RepID=A0A653D8P8_CALMS|nr:unnamed protein product [Callosobruchus maculatus]